MPKQSIPNIIHNQVDSILFEEGSFSPLNWLLKEGYLDYSDYQNWKKGRAGFLEDHFKTATEEIISALETVREYASLHKLESFEQKYISATGEALHFCRSSKNELIFTCIYEPANDRMQMDLFFDSAEACIISDLITAITHNNSEGISNLMERLESSNPEKYQEYTQLLALEKSIAHSGTPCNKKIKILLQQLSPLTFELLGRFAQDFLTSLWRKLSTEIEGRRFDFENPECHLSFTAFKGFQWQQVLTSVERETNWVKYPVLIFRYAEACFKLNKEQEGIINWFKLFNLYPEIAEQLIEGTCNRVLISNWQGFSELEPELESSLLPAWMVMNSPALAKNSIFADNENEALKLIKNLVCETDTEISKTTINLRSQLQSGSPALFVHYMKVGT